jgi:hypothetical protein|nr:MAG TPA: hypothetical protein [Caudoviricetes sp.]
MNALFKSILGRLFYDSNGRLSLFKVSIIFGVSIICFVNNQAFASFITGLVVFGFILYIISPIIVGLVNSVVGSGSGDSEPIED